MSSEFTDAEGLIAPLAWPYRSHALGLGWVEEQARLADQLADTVGEVMVDVHGRWSGVLPGVYEAPGAQELYVAMDPARSAGETVSDRLRWGAKLMRNYSETVGGLRQRLANLETEATAWRSTVLPGIWVSAEDLPFVRVVELSAVGSFLEATSPFAQTQGVTLSWRDHRPSVERNQTYVTTIAGLTEQIRDAIETLVRGLQTVEAAEGRISALTFAMGGTSGGVSADEGEWFMRGRDQLEAMTPEQLVHWWTGLAAWQQESMADVIPRLGLDQQIVQDKFTDAIKLADESESGTDIAALDVTLQVFGHEEAAWAAAVTSAGGAAVASVVHAAGQSVFTRDCDEQAARRVATGLREGLSTASEDWEPIQAQEFALEMLRDVERTRHASAVGFLFGDQHGNPMGEEFTVVMATNLDAMERDPIGIGQPWMHTGPEPGILSLEILAQDGHPARLHEPLGRVLSTLGEYPDAALDWLSDDSTDEYSPTDDKRDMDYQSTSGARLEHYFLERDSSTSAGRDGFEGVAALWSGAQEATGGPLDPGSYDPAAGSYDPEVWEKVATMTTYALRGLGENEMFVPENVSTLGTIELAGGTVRAMPHLAHNPIYGYIDESQDDDPLENFRSTQLLPGLNGNRAIPDVSRHALADVAAAASSSPKSAGLLTQGVGRYQDSLASMAQEGQMDPREAISRIVKLEGFLFGAQQGGEAGIAARQDEVAEQAINHVSSAADFIPLPKKVGISGELALTGIVNWATDGTLDAWTNSLAEIQGGHSLNQDEKSRAVWDAAHALAQQLGVDGVTEEVVRGDFKVFYDATHSQASDGVAPE